MASETGAVYGDVEGELGVTFAATSGASEWPLQAAVTAAILVAERDMRIKFGVAALGTTPVEETVAIKWTADWCRRWRFDNAGSIPETSPVPAESQRPRVPSAETLEFINEYYGSTRGIRVPGIPDSVDC